MKKEIISVGELTFKLENYKADFSQEKKNQNQYDYKSFLNKKYEVLKTQISYLKDSEALTESDSSLFIGRTGIGKTDLAITQIVEFLLSNHRIYVYVSEGKVSSYFQQVDEILKIKRKNQEERHLLLSNLIIKDKFMLPIYNFLNYEQWINNLIKDVKCYSCKILFFDNISTSAFSWNGPTIESGFISYLCSQVNINSLIGLFYIHTSRNFNNFKIGKDEIRGNASNGHFVSNIFSLNDLVISGEQLRIIEVLKCRVNGSINNTFYQLEYKRLKKRGFYSKSFKISEKEANKYFFHNNRKTLSPLNQAKSK